MKIKAATDECVRRTISIGESSITCETGHSVKEWMNMFWDEVVWDFSVDDFINGAIEPQRDVLYWYIDGRFYETSIVVAV